MSRLSDTVRGPVLACAAWLAASAALAEPASQPPAAADAAAPETSSTAVGGIVVEGRSRKAVQSFAVAVDKFVHSQARPAPGPVKQLSRWGDPVCPTTSGLRKDFNDFVSKRVKEIAARVGAPGGGKCRDANVLIVFTTQPDKLMADVRDHEPGLLGYHFIGETKRLAAFEPPMKSWYVTATWIPEYVTKDSPEVRIFDQAYVPNRYCVDQGQCAIPPPLKSRFAFALVVIDAGRTEGKPIGAVADEIAMTVLSRPGPREGCSPLPSVMDLLDPACPSSGTTEALTPYDEAFLKSLYAVHPSEILAYERAEIERSVASVGQPGVAGP